MSHARVPPLGGAQEHDQADDGRAHVALAHVGVIAHHGRTTLDDGERTGSRRYGEEDLPPMPVVDLCTGDDRWGQVEHELHGAVVVDAIVTDEKVVSCLEAERVRLRERERAARHLRGDAGEHVEELRLVDARRSLVAPPIDERMARVPGLLYPRANTSSERGRDGLGNDHRRKRRCGPCVARGHG